jgi:hypothetical protein
MILPSKHISLAESIIGLGGILLEILIKQPCSLDSLWQEYSKINNKKDLYPAYHSFDNVILAVNLLYIIGAITINAEGKLYRYEAS